MRSGAWDDVVRLASVEDAGARPVYHVQVAAGTRDHRRQRGILAHDERVGFPATAMFDAASIERNGPTGR